MDTWRDIDRWGHLVSFGVLTFQGQDLLVDPKKIIYNERSPNWYLNHLLNKTKECVD